MIAILVPLSEVDPETVRPGWVALLVVLALGGATLLLWRNMGKQLKKIDFDEDRATAPPEPKSGPPAREHPGTATAAAVEGVEQDLPDDRRDER